MQRKISALLTACFLLLAVFAPQTVFAAGTVTRAQVDEAIALTLNYYATRPYPVNADWESFAINAVGEDVNEYGQGQRYLEILAASIAQNDVGGAMTDYERTTLGILSAGADPTDFAGVNLIERIYNWQSLSQGINAAVFGLIALDAAGAVVPGGAKQTRESLLDYILSHKTGDGWAYSGSRPDPDMTGMALYAIAPYRDRLDVKMAGEAAIKWLSENQDEDGGYKSYGASNSESCSQVICGVTAWGVDPQSEAFTKAGGNVVSALLSFQITGANEYYKGAFCHIKPNADTNFATQQALYALGALKDFMTNGQSRIFYRISYNKEDVSYIEILPGRLELSENTVFGLEAQNQNGNPIGSADIDWSSSAPAAVSVDAGGVLTTHGKGAATITAALKSDATVVGILEVAVLKQEFSIEKLDAGAAGGASHDISFRVTNGGTDAQTAVCIIGLYDKTSRALIEANYISKRFEPGQSHVFRAEFNAPSGGNYEIKAMLWNDWYRGRVLCEAVIR
ncbi:MAG: hypothetical protein LBK57_03075 [Clostridiales Family XIII bacterium]|jgi:hypothetical protein|nr:hypothetical protein [Clostridiales Family XIII bacterium]